MREENYKQLINNMSQAYLCGKIIQDEHNRPADFVILEANPAFEKLTGYKLEKIQNGLASELVGKFSDADKMQLELCGKIAETGESTEYSFFSQHLNSELSIQLQSPEKGIFCAFIKKIPTLEPNESNHKDINFLNYLAFQFINTADKRSASEKMLKSIRRHTGASIAIYTEYDTEQKVLKPLQIDADKGIVGMIVRVANKKILSTLVPVSDEAYQQMLNEISTHSDSLCELTFGAITEKKSQSLKAVAGISHFYVVVHIVEGRLYGTSMLGFKSKENKPSKQLLSSYAHLSALAIERETAEDALRKSESRLRRITDNISDVVFTTDIKLNTTYVTPSIEKLTGEKPEAHLKKTITEKFTPKSIAKIQTVLAEELANEHKPGTDKNRSRIIEAEHYTAEGEIINVSMHLSFIRNESGKAVGIQGVTRDISEQKSTESKLKTIIENIPDLLFYFDRNGRIINFSSDYLQTQSADFSNKTIYDLFDQELANSMQHAINQTLHTGNYNYVYQKSIKDKTEYFDAKFAKISKQEVLAIVRNITQQKKQEVAFRESRDKLQQLLNALGEGVGIVDLDEIFIYTNPAADRIFETETGELIGSSLINFLPPDSIKKVEAETAKRKSGLSTSYELKIITKKQKERYIILTVTPHYEQKKLQGSFGVFRDITDIKNTEFQLTQYTKELNQLNNDKDRFLSILAHDLRSPFNSLLGFSEILINNYDDFDEATKKRQISLMRQTIQSTYNLLNDLLLWSKSQSGKLSFQPEKFSLKDTCRSLSEEMKLQADYKNITISCTVIDDFMLIADKNMLRTVLRNLISNAVKFTERHGKVEVSARHAENSKALITVTDNGVGISQEAMKSIWSFEKMYTTEGTGEEKGTGFGLMLCKEFVEKHGGKIWAESRPGTGSSFMFTVPLANENSK